MSKDAFWPLKPPTDKQDMYIYMWQNKSSAKYNAILPSRMYETLTNRGMNQPQVVQAPTASFLLQL